MNGKNQGQAFSIPNHMKKSAFHPAICLKNAAVSVNFGGAGTQFAFPGKEKDLTGMASTRFKRIACCIVALLTLCSGHPPLLSQPPPICFDFASTSLFREIPSLNSFRFPPPLPPFCFNPDARGSQLQGLGAWRRRRTTRKGIPTRHSQPPVPRDTLSTVRL